MYALGDQGQGQAHADRCNSVQDLGADFTFSHPGIKYFYGPHTIRQSTVKETFMHREANAT